MGNRYHALKFPLRAHTRLVSATFRSAWTKPWAVFPVHVRLGPDDEFSSYRRPVPDLSDVAALQLPRYFASELTINHCASQRCTTWFSVQRGSARPDDARHRGRGALYCCPPWAKAQAEGDRRAVGAVTGSRHDHEEGTGASSMTKG